MGQVNAAQLHAATALSRQSARNDSQDKRLCDLECNFVGSVASSAFAAQITTLSDNLYVVSALPLVDILF